jgi:Uma2 family endonuclease
MKTLLSDPLPSEVEEMLERRKRLGQDRKDEVWEGVYHVAPAPHDRHADAQAQIIELLGPRARAAGLRNRGELNIGAREDFRVPDAALLRPGPGGVYLPTAALVVEIVSPDDDTWQKLPFYAAHDVDELLIVDPDARELHWLGLTDGSYEPIERSSLIDLSPAQLAEQIDWP